MAKYRFKIEEKFALWEVYSHICPWCHELIAPEDLTIDHIIPEHLSDKPDELYALKKEFSLPDEFAINDFANWVPCHSKCNQKKGAIVYDRSPALIRFLSEARRKARDAKAKAASIVKQLQRDKILGKLEAALEYGSLSIEDVQTVISKAYLLEDGAYLRIEDDWTVWSVDGDDIALVVRGRHSGRTPVKNHHSSWRCSRCGEYGPWQGNRCLSCGNSELPE